jgi:hypothetical protein
MQPRWVVVRDRDSHIVAKFASRYAATAFAERQAEPSGRHIVLSAGKFRDSFCHLGSDFKE